MIFSPENKFLMIKNYKVGSTSVEVELSKVFSDKAIVTPILPMNKKHIPRNYSGFYGHMPYSEIKEKIDLFDVKVYTITRNPYDIVLSDIFFRMNLDNPNFNPNKITKKELRPGFEPGLSESEPDVITTTLSEHSSLICGSNARHFAYKANALTTELRRQN